MGGIVLMRFTDKWQELATQQVSGDFEYGYYRASTPSFSYFAIALKQQAANEIFTPAPEGELIIPTGEAVQSGDEKQEFTEPAKNNRFIEIMLIAGIILITAAIFISRKHHFSTNR